MQKRIDDLVETELTKRAYGLLPVGLLATAVNSAIIALLHWNLVNNTVLVIWFSTLFCITAVRAMLMFRFQRTARESPIHPKWKRRFNAGIFASGVVWGLTAFFHAYHDSLPHEMLVIFVLGGMAAGAAATFSFLRPAYWFFAIPALLPQSLALLMMADPIRFALAGMLLFFLFLISLPAEQNAKITRSDFRMVFEREHLFQVLSQEKERSDSAYNKLRQETAQRESAQRQLAAAHAGLEQKVAQRTTELAQANRKLRLQMREREHAEQALRQSEELYRTMVETAQEGIWLIQTDGLIRYANGRMAELLGWSAAGLKGMNVRKFMGDSESEYYKKPNVQGIRELRMSRRDGKEICVLEAANCLRCGTDTGNLTLAMVTDITLREEWEREIIELNRRLQDTNTELSAFAHSVSHDLRAPLRSIEGFSEALAEESAVCLDETGRDYLNRLRKSARRMKELIDDLLMLSRVSQSGLHRAPTDLSGLADEIMNNLRMRDPDREVSITIETGLAANCDARLLRVALENLFDNAWKFTARTRLARIEFGALQEPEGTIFYVADNGAGFNMAFADRLFRPFQRLHLETEFSGTGIGLVTVHRVIRRHGGEIWVQSEPGKGTTFYFTLESAAVPVSKIKGRIEPRAATLSLR